MTIDTSWVADIAAEMKVETEELRSELLDLSHSIHDNPELRFEEFQASAHLTKYLQQMGFSVSTGIADMPTAFRAEKQFGDGGPTIGVFCEYDALPDIGHACGHNIIAAAGAGAGVAACNWLQKKGSHNCS